MTTIGGAARQLPSPFHVPYDEFEPPVRAHTLCLAAMRSFAADHSLQYQVNDVLNVAEDEPMRLLATAYGVLYYKYAALDRRTMRLYISKQEYNMVFRAFDVKRTMLFTAMVFNRVRRNGDPPQPLPKSFHTQALRITREAAAHAGIPLVGHVATLYGNPFVRQAHDQCEAFMQRLYAATRTAFQTIQDWARSPQDEPVPWLPTVERALSRSRLSFSGHAELALLRRTFGYEDDYVKLNTQPPLYLDMRWFARNYKKLYGFTLVHDLVHYFMREHEAAP